MAVGGSMEKVAIRGRVFPVAADADSNRDLGGYTNETLPNGDGSARKKKTRKPWKVDGVALEIDDNRGDQEFLQEIADSEEFVPMTFTYVTGISYSGRGTVEGDLQASSAEATAPLTFTGPGKLEVQ